MDTGLTSCGRPVTVHIQLPPGAQAAGHARQAAARMLAPEPALCPGPVAEDLVLIVSELVTNAVRHAKGPYALTVSMEKGRVGIAVSDGSVDLPGRRHATEETAESERGLKIVRALGADLFVSPSDIGKQVIAVVTW
ncbi:ATP-binding protein [Streptomyces sp. NK15101]|uniref:ATP-binding protein n=1 Tax=Streptomyces sp. NK15101 TaxID=2873261 RepID=UPI001CEDF907|nr:ATP-binding protein [Streptomyces sp. NK15101]